MSYFNKQLLPLSYKCWFAGALAQAPSTNNAVEATNARIKNDFDFRTRPKLHVFKEKIFHILKVFSGEYRDGIKAVRMDIPISDKLWEESLTWAKSEKRVQQVAKDENGIDVFFVPSGEALTVSKANIKAFTERKWTSFEQFVEITTKVWCVKLHTTDPSKSACTCPAHLKEYVCKHVLGLRIRLKTISAPDHIQTAESKKKPRGRPARIPPALVRE